MLNFSNKQQKEFLKRVECSTALLQMPINLKCISNLGEESLTCFFKKTKQNKRTE